LVIDPCAGGGTVVDACLVMGRRCLAFDSDPSACAARKDIHLKDAIEAIKGLTRKADFIFLDTPYYKKMDKGYGENSISRFGKEEYLKFFSDLAAAAHEKLNKGGHVALLMSDYIDEDNPDEEIFIEDYIDIFKKAGFRRTRRIHCDLSTQQIHPDYINKFTDNKRLAILARDLVIFSLA
jgi:DNA modification methylase